MKTDNQNLDKKILRVYTESGDKYKFRISKNITDDELEIFLRKNMPPEEWEKNEDGEHDGPGFRGSYIHIDED